MNSRQAPILVSVYNRPEHLRRCVESLYANTESRQSDLFIVSDSPGRSADEAAVAEARRYIREIRGFRSVTAIEHPKNLGSFGSITAAISAVLTEHGRLIFLEDDNVVSPHFLAFMTTALDYYAGDESVFSVCGYGYPVSVPKSYPFDVYRYRGFCAWGAGLWLDRWRAVRWDCPGLDELRTNRGVRRRLNLAGEHVYQQLVRDANLGRKTADSIIVYHLVKNGLFSIFPVVSRVRNTGTDGSGEHCGVSRTYQDQKIHASGDFRLVEGPCEDDGINRVLRRYFSIPGRQKLAAWLGDLLPSGMKRQLRRLSGATRRCQR